MGNCVDREVAASRKDSDIETQAARQAHYIKWAGVHDIDDPCGSEPGRERIAAIYIKYVMMGINYYNKIGVRAATVKGYADAVNTLFELRGFKPPANFSDPNNMVNILVTNLKREEDVAKQRSPLDNHIFALLQDRAAKSKSQDSADVVLFNTVALGRITGHRLSEYAQTKQNKVDVHKYPSGRQVVKAYTSNDFIFFDGNGQRLLDLSEASKSQVASMRVTWRIQKNRQNGQSLNIAVDSAHPAICPVLNALSMVLRARRLNHPMDSPVAFYTNKNGEKLYLMGGKIAQLFRSAAKSCRPDTPKEELSKYSAHSIRVWACVLLDEAGKSPEFIKKRLRWMGDSFRMYLRDTKIITGQHRDALDGASTEVMHLIATMASSHAPGIPSSQLTETDENDLPNLVPEDWSMGDYDEDMD